MLQGHGDDSYTFGKPIVADFSSNVYYGGEPPGLKEHIFNNWNAINKYPEVLAESLTLNLANHHDLKKENILVTNGTTESIYLTAQAFKSSHSIIPFPTFSEYEDACRINDHKISFISYSKLAQEKAFTSDLIFICNPNNPTGEVILDIVEKIEGNPNTLFVIDEAFIEFTFSISSIINLVSKHKNLIVMRSMTKAYVIPGLRLGYMAASEKLINQLKGIKQPWSVNALAIEAGNFLISNLPKYQIPLKEILSDKFSFIQALNSMGATETSESHTHYFLVKLNIGAGKQLKNFLIDNFQILIRDASNFRGLGEEWIRVATLSAVSNRQLVRGISDWFEIERQ